MFFIRIGNNFYGKTSTIRTIYRQEDNDTTIYVDYKDYESTDEIIFDTKEERDMAWQGVEMQMMHYRKESMPVIH